MSKPKHAIMMKRYVISIGIISNGRQERYSVFNTTDCKDIKNCKDHIMNNISKMEGFFKLKNEY